MFYSTRYFFRLAGLLLAVYLVCARFPNILWGLQRVWDYIRLLFFRYSLDDVVSAVYTGIYGILKGIRGP
jgi:hypothetical protein